MMTRPSRGKTARGRTAPGARAAAPATATALALLYTAPAAAQQVPDTDEDDTAQGPEITAPDLEVEAPPENEVIDEIVAVGRQRETTTDVLLERIEQEVVTDFLGAEAISRVGDTTVSAALRRVPGLTLVDDKFIYVRGLGERYSTALLNGAQVPSPDLTRNVIPLDIFPTAIIDSVSIQKGYTPDLPASFAGGNIDIRTKGIPEDFTFNFEVGSGWNSDSSDDGFSYGGGGDDFLGEDDGTRALPLAIRNGIQDFQGQIAPEGIFQALTRDGQFHTVGEAEAINRELGASLNTDIAPRNKSLDPDFDIEATIGNRWYFGEGERWEFGALGVLSYDNSWRNRERIRRSVLDPVNETNTTLRTINQVAVTGIANFGLRFTADHEITTASMLIRNTEDEASIQTGNNFNFQRLDGQQFRNYNVRYEERELRTNQISGSHTLGSETLAILDWAFLRPFENLNFGWYYSDSTAETEIPNEVVFSAEDTIDPQTGELIATSIRRTGSAADFRFTDLADEVESYGWDLGKPFLLGNLDMEFTGGWDYTRKGRAYLQTRLGLGTTALGTEDVLSGTPRDVFTEENILDPDNGFELTLGGLGTESYLAAQTIEGAYGQFDVYFNESWRVAGGLRWEQFQQASLPINPNEFDPDVGQIAIPPSELASTVFQEDDIYPAFAVTYSLPDFWAETFQLRFGWSETATRPDLREISESTYIDPLTEARVRGNSRLVTSQIQNYDIRAEWFFASGDNFTTSLFYKDIEDPIETVGGDGADDNIVLGFINGESAELYGIEVEALKSFAFLSDRLGRWTDGLYVSGNFTLSDSEITIGSAVLDVTNNTRRMTQHSEYVANVQIGYDSLNGVHAVTLVYNTFGDRLFFAGQNGAQDAFEQPFDSLDLIYSIFPTDSIALKFKFRNLLDDDIAITQDSLTTGDEVTILEQTVGTTASLDFEWKF